MASLYDRISKGTMSVDEITASMVAATSECGKFFKSMEKQSQTLNGQLSTLKDNADQLLGSLTEGLSEELRTELLPLANNMIGELQDAYAKGGTQGLIDSATEMIPDLLNMMSGEVQSAIAGVSKWLPKGASALMKAVPSALRGASSALPQITTALFEVASTVVADLVSMLPELAPMFLQGAVDMTQSTLNGMFDMVTGVYNGIEQAMHKGKKKIAGVWVDESNIAKYNFDIDVGTTDAKNEIETAYKDIRDALNTDLLTPEQQQGILDMIGEDYDTIKAKLLSFGLNDTEATQIADALTRVGTVLQTDLLTEEQKQEVLGMIGEDYDAIKAKLLSFGLSEAEADQIAQAFTTAGNALQTDLLTEDQKNAIIDLIGEDYDTIKAKLLSFGLSEEEAEAIANSVKNAGDELIQEYYGLNVGIDATTLAKLTAQANGSRIVLKGLLKDIGLNDSDIAQVVAVYDEMMGKVGEQTPSIIEEIYDKLTDGQPDDEQTVSALKEKIQTYINGLLADLEAAYAAKSAELDVTAADYQEKKAALDEWYNSTKTSITGMNTDMTTLVDTLAGAPTSVVQARMAEFVEMERELLEIEGKIDEMTAKARSAAENAFAVVRSGANADEATISQAIKLKVTEFKLDEQSAEDAYTAAVEQLNADFTSGKITKEEYDAGMETAQSELDSAKNAAKTAYEKALNEIFSGIAESEGIENNAAETAEKIGLAETLMQIKDGLGDTGLVGEQLGDEMTQKLAEHMQIDPEILKTMPMDAAKSALEDWALQLYTEATTGIEALDNSKLATAYAAALEEGVLAGTKFDTDSTSKQIEALLIGIYETGAENASPEVQEIGAGLVEDANEGAAGSGEAGTDRGDEFGSGYVAGIGGWISKVYNKAKSLAQAASQGAADGQESASPSKAARRLGVYFGDGYNIGLQESMERAVLTAKRLSGQIVTSADISRTMRVNIPNLQQEIVLANEQTATPVYLNGKQIAAIQGHNNSVQLAWDNNRSSKGVGRK